MKNTKLSDIKRNWHLIDAKGKILGRLSTDIAKLLMGKNKSYYTPHLDTGDFVVVTNAKDVVLSGKKETQKKYYRHSGYPGGLHFETASQIRQKSPQLLIRHATIGMLPKTRLGKIMLKKLFIYADSNHPYAEKFVTTRNAENNVRSAKTIVATK